MTFGVALCLAFLSGAGLLWRRFLFATLCINDGHGRDAPNSARALNPLSQTPVLDAPLPANVRIGDLARQDHGSLIG